MFSAIRSCSTPEQRSAAFLEEYRRVCEEARPKSLLDAVPKIMFHEGYVSLRAVGELFAMAFLVAVINALLGRLIWIWIFGFSRLILFPDWFADAFVFVCVSAIIPAVYGLERTLKTFRWHRVPNRTYRNWLPATEPWRPPMASELLPLT